MTAPFAKTIDSAIALIRARQRSTGEFATSVSRTSQRLDGPLEELTTPFDTTFVMDCLRHVHHPEVPAIRDRAAQFLVKAMTPDGVWYWADPVLLQQWLAHWPDADDTACCSYALRTMGIEPPELARNQQLLLGHRDPRGAFLSWLDHGKRPQGNDVDTVVNANVVLYLGETPETRRAIEHLNHVIASNAEHHSYWYYLDHLTLYYAISRALHAGVSGLEPSRRFLVERTLQRRDPDGSFGGDLQTALAIATLINCGARSEVGPAVEVLASRQHDDGGWTAHALYAAQRPPFPGIFIFWCGSTALTTALCVEAIARAGEAR